MIGIIAFTNAGKALAYEIGDFLINFHGEEVDFFSESSMKARDYVEVNFHKFKQFIFIGAVGICFRLVSPYIEKKDVDPGVLVIDEKGKFVIPVLSGHIGGANEFALKIADRIGATPVITTATDINNKFAVDVWATKSGAKILDIREIKHISAAVLKDEKIGLVCKDFSIEGKMPECIKIIDNNSEERPNSGILVSFKEENHIFNHTLQVIPQILALGVGCRKDTDTKKFETFVFDFLKNNNILLKAIEKIGSIDLKKNEKCILDFSHKYNIPFETYSSQELMKLNGDFHHSDFVERTTGTDNVSERSAVMAGGGKLIVKRVAKDGMTLSLAIRDWSCKF